DLLAIATGSCWTAAMDVASLLLELYGRVPALARSVVQGLDVDQLTWSPSPGANTIAWLIWHLARGPDHHVAEILDVEQLGVAGDWANRCGLAPDPSNPGYGPSADEVVAVRPESADVLLEYLDAVDTRATAMLRHLHESDLDRIVDRRWDPPVTL